MILRPGASTMVLLAFLVSHETPSVFGQAEQGPAVDGYADFDMLRVQLEQIARSPLARLSVLGRTREKREVLLLTIGKGRGGDRPGILVIGGLDATQLFGGELAVGVARQLVERAGRDEQTARLLERVTFYVVPRASPDACESFFSRPFEERTANTRPTDDDNDHRVDEDPPCDLNGDGWITAMRVEEPGGRSMEHPDDSRVMILAAPEKGEQGRWSLYTEGVDADGDGELNEDPVGGVAFDRNFTFHYPYFKAGAGPYQLSEPETRALADFAFSRRNIAIVFTFTTQDNLFHPPKGETSEKQGKIKTKLLQADAPYLERMGKLYRELHGGTDSPPPSEGTGSVSDWAYFHYGRWSLAARPSWIPPQETAKQEGDSEPSEPTGATAGAEAPNDEERGRDELRALAWFASVGIDGFVPWERIEHPDFPGRRVEVGGFKPYLRTNPPLDKLDDLADKHAEFLCQVADTLPKLHIAEAKAEALGSSVWRVTATVVNRGQLPSFSQMGELSRQTQPAQIVIDLPEGATLVTGHRRRRLPTLAAGSGHDKQVWLIRCTPDLATQLQVRAWAPAVGEARKAPLLQPPAAAKSE